MFEGKKTLKENEEKCTTQLVSDIDIFVHIFKRVKFLAYCQKDFYLKDVRAPISND